eukprot:gene329-420_t
MSAFAITVSANAYAAGPFSFGVRLGGVNHNALGFSKSTADHVGGKDAKSKLINIGGSALAFVEYAITDIVGIGADAGYFYGNTGNIVPGTKSTDEKSINVFAHGIKLNPAVKFYPMGREEENGILKINVIGDVFFPVNVKVTNEEKNTTPTNLVADKSKEVNLFTAGAGLGVAYEFPFGLELEWRAAYAFNNLLKNDVEVRTKSLGLDKDKKDHAVNVQLSAGFNIASLLEA